MNITIYTLNNTLLYLIYLQKEFISVITIIAVQLDYWWYCVRSVNRILR